VDGHCGITPRQVLLSPRRTDNAIKNYFYSTIRRSLRRMGKFVGSKNSTEQMKRIKPSTLSKIFAAGADLPPSDGLSPEEDRLVAFIRDNCDSVRQEIVQFTNYKPRRKDQAPEEERVRFERVMEKMAHINDVYERIKGEQKLRRYEEQMFQKDYNRLMRSDSSEHPSDQEEEDHDHSHSHPPRNTTPRSRRV
jgi:transcriptional activator Myb